MKKLTTLTENKPRSGVITNIKQDKDNGKFNQNRRYKGQYIFLD